MPALSLRLVSVVICVVLTLITAVLTLAVSTSFTTKAVNDIGQRYSSSLASNLKANVVSYLQKAVDQYSSLAEYTRTRPTGTPNSTWSPTWNGSFWTFNPADLSQVEPYYAMKLQTMVSHNFSRESSTVTCFADGTWLQVTKNTFFPGPAFYTSTIAGLPDGRALDWTTMTYSSFLFYGEDRKPYAPFPGFLYPSTPDPWAMPITSCSAFTTCSNLDCRGAPSYIEAASYGPERCFWVAPQLSIWPSIANGVYCTMFNSLDQRLGVTGSLMQLTAVSDFVAGTQRTANGQAFVVDSTNWGLLGSTYVQAFQGAWVYGNVTIDYFAPQLQELRNGSGFPITLVGAGTGSSDQPGMPFTGALVMNATYLKVKPNCQIGIFTPHIVCQETVDTYQYQPLRSLRDAIGLDPAVGFRQGSIAADGETYYYAVDGITTRMQGAEVPGLRWSVVVLTPQQDVLGEVSKGRTYSIVATCCFFVFAAGCCFALFTVFLRPLVDLEDRMLLTANLADDNDTSEDVSALSEIRNMQKSFYRMRVQLRKLKSFVPQSVLAALDDDDDEDAVVAVIPNNQSVRALDYSERSARTEGDRISLSRNKDGTQTPTDTRTSHSKRSSSKHSVITGSGVAVRALNMQLGLTKKIVSVMVFNVMGLHSAIKSRTADEVTLLHSKLVDSFSTIVSGGKGIVDSFQGDRFVATFNAVTNNAQHAVRAAVAAQEMLAAFARLRSPFPRAGVGIATGEALVGNGGCDTMRRFCTIGRVYTQATVMERLTKQHASADVLLTQGTASQLAHEFYVEALDVLQFEGQSKPSLVYALRDRMNHAMEEWNYAMQQNEERDKYSKLNEAFAAYRNGDPTQARAVLAAYSEASRQCAGYATLSSLLQENTDPTTRTAQAQGLFFARSFGATD